jgi:hypothetical protein
MATTATNGNFIDVEVSSEMLAVIQLRISGVPVSHLGLQL